MATLVGVDVGGSHTEAAVADRSLTLLSRTEGPGAALQPGHIAESARIIVDLILRSIESARNSGGPSAVVVGAAGAGRREFREALRKILWAELGKDCQLAITSDAEIALESAFGQEPGIMMASGSGSVGFVRDPNGRLWRVGGLGWRHGDQGSGYALSVGALEFALRAEESEPARQLAVHLRQVPGCDSLEEALARLRAGDRSQVVALAHAVNEMFESGNPLAASLIREAAEHLANHITATVDRFPSDWRPVPVALGGGVLSDGSPVRRELLDIFQRRIPEVNHVDIEIDPPLGALAMAARL